jgi:hypothetical protein
MADDGLATQDERVKASRDEKRGMAEQRRSTEILRINQT